MIVHPMHPQMTLDHLGYIPRVLSDNDPRPMKEQINDRYAYGGGWSPVPGYKHKMGEGGILKYPGDPAHKPLARIQLSDGRSEFMYFYEHSIVAIVQADGSFEVSRMD